MSGDHTLGHASAQPEITAYECVDFIEQIVYLIDNELDEAGCVEVRVHLEECTPCLERYDLQRTVKSVVARSCSELAPADLRSRVMLRLREVQVSIVEG